MWGKLRYELTLYLGFIALVSKAFVNHLDDILLNLDFLIKIFDRRLESNREAAAAAALSLCLLDIVCFLPHIDHSSSLIYSSSGFHLPRLHYLCFLV